jgi:hypothetical protein
MHLGLALVVTIAKIVQVIVFDIGRHRYATGTTTMEMGATDILPRDTEAGQPVTSNIAD